MCCSNFGGGECGDGEVNRVSASTDRVDNEIGDVPGSSNQKSLVQSEEERNSVGLYIYWRPKLSFLHGESLRAKPSANQRRAELGLA